MKGKKPAKASKPSAWANYVPPPSIARPGVYAKIQKLCLSLPEVTERPSHGAPTFFAGTKAFAKISDNHHHDGRYAVIVIAAPGVQKMLVDSDPDQYYEPPYVRHLGWVGVRLDRKVAWSAIAALLEAAYLEVAPVRTRSTGRSASRRPS
jgi:hypothetical protein